jgi:transposase-like protein
MIDGIHFRDRVILLAIGIDAQGNKHVLGLREGSTEAARVVTDQLILGVRQRQQAFALSGGQD